jgi:uracil-DNA glycosylase family 4
MAKRTVQTTESRARAPQVRFEGSIPGEPPRDCDACPRLYEFIASHRENQPDWYNAPVKSFGDPDGALLIVGLAPGLRGANRTGRPFTGDFAGDLLYATLDSFGFSSGQYDARPDDGLALTNCMITNAVRCVPPQNKPTPAEIRTCQPFLTNVMRQMPNLRAIVVLGRVAHDTMLRTLGLRLAQYPFSHGARHDVTHENRQLAVFDSYHCSRYNTNTGVLTEKMFADVFRAVRKAI